VVIALAGRVRRAPELVNLNLSPSRTSRAGRRRAVLSLGAAPPRVTSRARLWSRYVRIWPTMTSTIPCERRIPVVVPWIALHDRIRNRPRARCPCPPHSPDLLSPSCGSPRRSPLSSAARTARASTPWPVISMRVLAERAPSLARRGWRNPTALAGPVAGKGYFTRHGPPGRSARRGAEACFYRGDSPTAAVLRTRRSAPATRPGHRHGVIITRLSDVVVQAATFSSTPAGVLHPGPGLLPISLGELAKLQRRDVVRSASAD